MKGERSKYHVHKDPATYASALKYVCLLTRFVSGGARTAGRWRASARQHAEVNDHRNTPPPPSPLLHYYAVENAFDS